MALPPLFHLPEHGNELWVQVDKSSENMCDFQNFDDETQTKTVLCSTAILIENSDEDPFVPVKGGQVIKNLDDVKKLCVVYPEKS